MVLLADPLKMTSTCVLGPKTSATYPRGYAFGLFCAWALLEDRFERSIVGDMDTTSKILPRSYFNQPTLDVARSLIGTYLVRDNGQGRISGKIIEAEAYVGPDDQACHASKGRTQRTDVMFGPAGVAYVYLIYGMHHCLNVVTEREDFPAAVLIRAIEIEGRLVDGPGQICRELDIDRTLNRHDLTKGEFLWLEGRKIPVPPMAILAFPRIGVDYAGLWAQKLWRFRLQTGGDASRKGSRTNRARQMKRGRRLETVAPYIVLRSRNYSIFRSPVIFVAEVTGGSILICGPCTFGNWPAP